MTKKIVSMITLCSFLFFTVLFAFASQSQGKHDKPKAEESAIEGIITFCGFLPSRMLDGVDVAVVGIPLDQATNNRSGTRFGPRSVRTASQIYRLAFESGKGIFNTELDRYLLGGLKMIDYGDVTILPTLTELNMKMMTDGIKDIGNVQKFRHRYETAKISMLK